MDDKNKKANVPVIGGVLGDKVKHPTHDWVNQPHHQKASHLKGKATKAFNRKKAGR